MRLLEVGPFGDMGVSPVQHGQDAHATEVSMHKIVGGYLVQQRDLLGVDEANWKVASNRKPCTGLLRRWHDLKFAWLVCKHT